MVSKPSSAESAPNDLASFSLVVGALSPTSPSPHSVPTTLPCLTSGIPSGGAECGKAARSDL